jgi:hypothetical protein
VTIGNQFSFESQSIFIIQQLGSLSRKVSGVYLRGIMKSSTNQPIVARMHAVHFELKGSTSRRLLKRITLMVLNTHPDA